MFFIVVGVLSPWTSTIDMVDDSIPKFLTFHISVVTWGCRIVCFPSTAFRIRIPSSPWPASMCLGIRFWSFVPCTCLKKTCCRKHPLSLQNDGRLCGDLYRRLFESSIGPSWTNLQMVQPINHKRQSLTKAVEKRQKKYNFNQLYLVFKLSNTWKLIIPMTANFWIFRVLSVRAANS